MTPSLKIKSPSTSTVVSIPRGTDFIIYPWGFSEIYARYTKKGKVIIYDEKLVRKCKSKLWVNYPLETYVSARSFLNRWNKNIVIENTHGMGEYWDIAIYTEGTDYE